MRVENIVIVAEGEDRLKIAGFGEASLESPPIPPFPPALPRHPSPAVQPVAVLHAVTP